MAMQKTEISGLARALRRAAAVLVLGGGALLFAAPAPAQAQARWHSGWHGGGYGGWHGGGWRGGWHGGGWRGGWHGGWRGGWCCGWGWGPSVSLFWGWPGFYGYPYYEPPYAYYPAPAPVYYPPAAPEAAQTSPGPAPAQSWYYCDNPRGYYPYVQSCSTGWRAVPVTPQGAPPTR
jgi:hypothetical protein